MTSPSATSRWIVAGSRRIPLVEGEHIIGREPTATLQLGAVDISRRHARLLVASDDVRIEDLESKNGPMVNDTPVSGRVTLHDGDRIQVGTVVVIYHESHQGCPRGRLTVVDRARNQQVQKRQLRADGCGRERDPDI